MKFYFIPILPLALALTLTGPSVFAAGAKSSEPPTNAAYINSEINGGGQ